MKFLVRTTLLLMLCALLTCTVRAQQGSEVPLTNAAIVKLVRAGFREKTVVAIIHSRPNRFNLEPERLIELKRAGVSENIIVTMLAQQADLAIDTVDWNDDSMFRSGGATSPNSGNGDSSGLDIFGSGGQSRSSTRGRGMSGSGQQDSITTGSATVRILRPPAEAGGGQLKLDKIPTLDNEAIVHLVEAGFSEGTIIKRIENSPAEFDISPAKLEELRRRRVSEAIILAMRAAMEGADPKSAASNPGGEK